MKKISSKAKQTLRLMVLLLIAVHSTRPLFATINTDSQALAAAQQWLALTDAGQVTQTWQTAAAHFRGAVSQAKWEQSLKAVQKPLGELHSRSLKSAQAVKSLPAAPGGPYTILQFDATFAKDRRMIETVTMVREQDGQWRTDGYFVASNAPVSGAFLIKYLASGVGMILVAVLAVLGWWWQARVSVRWFGVGAALWAVAVVLKIAVALLTNHMLLSFLKGHLPFSWYVAGGSLLLGLQSSLFEMGITFVAVLIWRQLGRDGHRAITIGVGAGAVEALLLGLGQLVVAVVLVFGLPGAEKIGGQAQAAVAATAVFWLAPPVERCVAILCHAATRSLVLLGVTQRRPMLAVWGILLFTLLDGVAGGFHLTGQFGKVSVWWVELAVLPFGLVSLPILNWCYRRWRPIENNV